MEKEKSPDGFKGVFPVLPTPMHDDQSLDMDGLKAVLDRALETGVPGLTVLGSSSESTYLTQDEKAKLLEAVVKQTAGRAKILAGVIRFGTVPAVEEAKRACDLGADALMVALPVYFGVTFDEVLRHYQAIVEASSVPVMYYHYPEPTGLHLKPKQVAALFDKLPLFAIKESVWSTPEMKKHLKLIKRKIAVFTGMSFNLANALSAGVVGLICPMSILLLKTSKEIFEAHQKGDKKAVARCQAKLFSGMPMVNTGSFPQSVARPAMKFGLATGIALPKPPGVPHSGVKQALASLGIIQSARIRDPQVPLSERKIEEITKLAPQVVEL